MTSSIFVWGIEQTLVSLFGFGIVMAWQSLATATVATADFWSTAVLLFSCSTTLAVQVVIAFTSINKVVSKPTDDGVARSDFSYLHTAVAQAHCCITVLIGSSYLLLFLTSIYDVVWASAFYPSAPGLLFATGSGTTAFCFALFLISVASVWACTSVGDSNTLFWYHPLFLMLCVIYPVLHEIGQNGLIICSKPLVTTLTFMYVNLTIASSFALHFMEIFEFDPAQVFPRYMHSIAGNRPFFRVYPMLHGLLIITPFLFYSAVSLSVSISIVFGIALLAVVATLLQSLDITTLIFKHGKSQAPSDENSLSVSDPDQLNKDSDDTKVKPLKSMNWFAKPREATNQHLDKLQDADTKQLRIDFMRVSRTDRNFIRKRG